MAAVSAVASEGRDRLPTAPDTSSLGPDGTDVAVAERLVRQGLAEPRSTQAAAYLRAALELSRARPLADLAGMTWLDQEAERLAPPAAGQALADAGLAMGEHAELVPELETLAREHPFSEPIHRQRWERLERRFPASFPWP